jgi:hypothetical protein
MTKTVGILARRSQDRPKTGFGTSGPFWVPALETRLHMATLPAPKLALNSAMVKMTKTLRILARRSQDRPMIGFRTSGPFWGPALEAPLHKRHFLDPLWSPFWGPKRGVRGSHFGQLQAYRYFWEGMMGCQYLKGFLGSSWGHLGLLLAFFWLHLVFPA